MNLLILVVVGVLAATAAATVFLGDRSLDDGTPHGQLLAALQRVAEEQEDFYLSEGRFGDWLHTLGIEAPDSIDLTVSADAGGRWEAIARHPVGLACSQSGRAVDGRPVQDPPVCFMSPAR